MVTGHDISVVESIGDRDDEDRGLIQVIRKDSRYDPPILASEA